MALTRWACSLLNGLPMNQNHSSNDRQRLWKRIAEDFRQACLLRREGKASEAAELLDKKLPETIAAWSRVCGLRDGERRERLNDLFELEQRRVDDIWLSQQIIMRQMRDILIPSLCLQVAEEVREVMEFQAEHLGEMLEEVSRPPAPAPAPVRVEPKQPAGLDNRIVKLPAVMPTERRSMPNFDDLPLIIDELISHHAAQPEPSSRVVALV